jgi:hypothetical protein
MTSCIYADTIIHDSFNPEKMDLISGLFRSGENACDQQTAFANHLQVLKIDSDGMTIPVLAW